MEKIFKVTQVSKEGYYYTSKTYVDENSMLRELKEIAASGGDGFVEVFEMSQKFNITEHLSSLKRDANLSSLLNVDEEVADYFSRFKKLLLTKEKVFKKLPPYLNATCSIDELEYLDKSDEKLVKKYFKKHRLLFLNYLDSTEEWYYLLLKLYNYTSISDHTTTGTLGDTIFIRKLSDKQKLDWESAKEKIKKEKKCKV
jgi:hypothetical protein